MVSEIQASTTNAGISAEGSVTPDLLTLSYELLFVCIFGYRHGSNTIPDRALNL